MAFGAGPWIARCCAVAAWLALAAPAVSAEEDCNRLVKGEFNPELLVFRLENDVLARQDQGYTSGLQIKAVTPNLDRHANDACLPPWARWLNRRLEWLSPENYEQRNLVFGLGQAIYTPKDPERSDLIEDDRPYAGVLLLSAGYNARLGNQLWATQLALGVVGPASYAEQTQKFFHRVFGSAHFKGWDNQLENEPVVLLLHERSQRWGSYALTPASDGLRWDAITHWGGTLGNLLTGANVGFEVRAGYRLPDDFGSSPLRPAGENTAPLRFERSFVGWSWHAFLNADTRLVLHDITLDGNSFRHSHHVHKRLLVGDVALGVAVLAGDWKLAFARNFGTREFNGQQQRPSFGSITLSREL
ncbi:lipid A deacylase LpxR family protein [Methylibium sp.]|uniref:lipid A deacylase LpxR family protein n=1 Tax=Methylibium sp. TaxID=2067992 RepID=UPI003D0BA8C9